jgi:uncharacterized protein (DUF58 family)
VDTSSPWRGFLTTIAVLAALLGFASGSAALVGFGVGWAALCGLAFVASRRRLRGLKVERRLPASAFEDDLLTVDLLLENHSPRPARFVVANDVFGAGLADRQSVLEAGPLPELHRRVLSYRAFVARQWGLYTVGPLSVGGYDPLGLFFAREEIPRLDAFEVFPKAVEIESLSARGGRASVSPHDVTASAAGQSLLFRGVREFRAGDDVRRIHWPATARRGIPMVREYERDLQPLFTVFLDLGQGSRAGVGRKSTLEYLIRVGASLLWTAHRRGDVLALVAESDRPVLVPPGQGEAHLAAGLHELVVARQRGKTPLVEVVERHREMLSPGSTAALVAGTTEIDLDALASMVKALHAGAVRPLAVVVDALSFTPVDRPPTPVEVARESRRALEERLLILQVPTAFLDASEAPEETLRRPDLFATPEQAAS